MARKRMIDPTIWADEDFGRLSSTAKVMFIGMISNADDDGILPGNAIFLCNTIFPFEEFSQKKAKKIKNEILFSIKSLKSYSIDGKEYLIFGKWKSYQSINKPQKSKYPTPPLRDDYGSTTVSLPPNRIEENRIEVLVSKDTKGVYTPTDNSLRINFILSEFEKRVGHIPSDAKPRQVAWNIVRLVNSFVKNNHALFEQLREIPLTYDYALQKAFQWYQKKDYIEHTEKLETVRLKMKVYFSDIEKQLLKERGKDV